MAGQYRFKDINGNIVAQISASAAGAISFSGSAVDFSNASTITLGEVQLAGTASNALLLDGFDSTAFVFTSSFNTISQSISSQLTTLQITSGSNIGRLNNLESKSSSVDISISNINQFTASNGNTSLNSKTGSYATTGSNSFYGTQVFSGSVYIANDLVVQGSSSIQYISASSVSIGTNIIQLNTATPSVRYAGISVQDSGSSAGITGSLLWDSLCNRWMYSNPSTICYSGGILMSGPRAANLGEETTLTCNYIAKSGGGDHLYDSCIVDDGTTTCIKNNLIGTGTGIFSSDFTSYGTFGSFGQLHIAGTTDPNKKLVIGYNTSANVGFIQSMQNGTTYTPLVLNSTGGNVGINTTNPLVKFVVQDDTTFCNTLDNGQIRIQGNTSCAKKLFLGIDTNCSTTFGYIQATETGVSTRSLILQPSGGHVGIGMNTPSSTVGKYLWLGDRTALVDDSFATSYLINNATFCSVFQRVRNGFASSITLDSNGNFNVNVSGCGAAGSTATFTTAFIVNNGGNVGIGIGSPSANGVGGSPTILNIHKAGSDAAALSLSNTSTTQDVAVGAINFASTGLSCTDKRLAEIAATKANNCTNTAAGNLSFYTSANAGLSEKMRITAGGFVGINCTDPGHVLDICGGVNINSEAYTKQGTVQSLRISSNVGNTAVTINACSLNNYSYLTFAQNCVGKFELGFSACTDSVSTSTFYMNPNIQKGACGSAVFIKSNGRVGIGEATPTSKLSVAGALTFTSDYDQTTATSIFRENGNKLTLGGGTSGIQFNKADMSVANVAFFDNGMACFRGLICAQGGVKFGTGATALNGYEEGTWTPRLVSSAWTSSATGANTGWYTRIGNLVTVGGTVQWTGGSGSQGTLIITCLPFTSNSTASTRNVGQIGAPGGDSISYNYTTKGQFVVVNDPNQASMYIIEVYQSGTWATYTHGPTVNSQGVIYGFQLTYHI